MGLCWKQLRIVLGEFRPQMSSMAVLFPGRSAAGIAGVLGNGCLPCLALHVQRHLPVAARSFPSSLIHSSALAMVLPSQVSNQMLWMISISLYKIWRDIFCREVVSHLPFLLLELSTVVVLPKKPAFFGYSNF